MGSALGVSHQRFLTDASRFPTFARHLYFIEGGTALQMLSMIHFLNELTRLYSRRDLADFSFGVALLASFFVPLADPATPVPRSSCRGDVE